MKRTSLFEWLKEKVISLVQGGKNNLPSTLPEEPMNKAEEPMNKAEEPKNKAEEPKNKEDQSIKTYKATGMQHRLESLLRLGVENADYLMSKKELVDEGLIGERVWEFDFFPSKVELIPEPDNAYDPNAIKVMVDGEHVAYIKKGSCAHLLKAIKGNRIKNIKCEIAGGRYKYISEDYSESGKEIYTLERDTAPYFVHLQVTEID